MKRYFNTAGSCNPEKHYMVDISKRLGEIKKLVDRGEYLTINRARQYGKTTTIKALAEYLRNDYVVLFLDFQMVGDEEFEDAGIFSAAFSELVLDVVEEDEESRKNLDEEPLIKMRTEANAGSSFSLRKLFVLLSMICKTAQKPVVLIIDEVDSATNNQVFLDFLAQLRAYYLQRDKKPTFQSVILAGVYDVKNIRRKIRPEDEHKTNSPWNIAADFKIDMSFSKAGIEGMLKEYEEDYHTGMNTEEMAELLLAYTSGYPFLVSRICKLMDEDLADSGDFSDKASVWTKEGFLTAVRMLLSESNTLFESLTGKMHDYPEMAQMVQAVLFSGNPVLYNPDVEWMNMAVMFGFIKRNEASVKIANRIFEMRLYNYFLATSDAQKSEIFLSAAQDKSQFIQNGHLNMRRILEKFAEHFGDIYGEDFGDKEKFDEDEGRRRFLLYLRPIINGTGNYYIEAETRNKRRMDVVVDYRGEQFIIELKIWRGNAYNERGEEQLSEYLDYFHLKKGYMLSYDFNKKKEVGVKEITVGDRILVEAVV